MAYTNGLLSELKHVQSGITLTDLAYQYDVDGQLTAIVDNLDPSRSKAISYDDLNCLVQVAKGVQGDVALPVEDYAYDQEGNRTARHLSALYTSNAHNQLVGAGAIRSTGKAGCDRSIPAFRRMSCVDGSCIASVFL